MPCLLNEAVLQCSKHPQAGSTALIVELHSPIVQHLHATDYIQLRLTCCEQHALIAQSRLASLTLRACHITSNVHVRQAPSDYQACRRKGPVEMHAVGMTPGMPSPEISHEVCNSVWLLPRCHVSSQTASRQSPNM